MPTHPGVALHSGERISFAGMTHLQLQHVWVALPLLRRGLLWVALLLCRGLEVAAGVTAAAVVAAGLLGAVLRSILRLLGNAAAVLTSAVVAVAALRGVKRKVHKGIREEGMQRE